MNNDKVMKEKELLKKYPKYFEPLDDEESQLKQDMDTIYEISNDSERKEEYAKIASEYLKNRKIKKSKPILLRINEAVLEKLKSKASDCGLNYQTYISLFLYQLSNDKFEVKIK
jgi:predicted DNA binding CopG/RHH family protein